MCKKEYDSDINDGKRMREKGKDKLKKVMRKQTANHYLKIKEMANNIYTQKA